jgi:hypothetical protein
VRCIAYVGERKRGWVAGCDVGRTGQKGAPPEWCGAEEKRRKTNALEQCSSGQLRFVLAWMGHGSRWISEAGKASAEYHPPKISADAGYPRAEAYRTGVKLRRKLTISIFWLTWLRLVYYCFRVTLATVYITADHLLSHREGSSLSRQITRIGQY